MNHLPALSGIQIQKYWPLLSFRLSLVFSILCFYMLSKAQLPISWQQSIGTESSDQAIRLFKDQSGNPIVVGLEPHADFTGNIRDYMMVTKLGVDGHSIWKTYHDVALETFNPPYEYAIGNEFYTYEWGDTLLNLVISLNTHNYLLKLYDRNGQYFSYDEIPSGLIDVQPNNDKIFVVVQCSAAQACYGPDSLTVQYFDPTPDSIIFNPVKWTYGVRQNIRTSPIQGHYDFDAQDIRRDSAGNVYLLLQIERWDFQFCTDCNDAFVDAWCEVFKFNPQGQLVKNQRITTSKAVVSFMRFVDFKEGQMTVRVDDINAANTAIVTSIFKVDADLTVKQHFSLGQQYIYVVLDKNQNIWGCTNIYDPSNPDIHGQSDVLMTSFDPDGHNLWSAYYGGSDIEWPRGLVTTDDDGLVFLANTASTDGDVQTSLGGQDIWVAKLGGSTTSIKDPAMYSRIAVFPNPSSEEIRIAADQSDGSVTIFDDLGRQLESRKSMDVNTDVIDIRHLPAGHYWLQLVNASGIFTTGFVKN